MDNMNTKDGTDTASKLMVNAKTALAVIFFGAALFAAGFQIGKEFKEARVQSSTSAAVVADLDNTSKEVEESEPKFKTIELTEYADYRALKDERLANMRRELDEYLKVNGGIYRVEDFALIDSITEKEVRFTGMIRDVSGYRGIQGTGEVMDDGVTIGRIRTMPIVPSED